MLLMSLVLVGQALYMSGLGVEMAHFAKVNSNIVEQVIVVSDADCGGGTFPESEPVGQAFIASLGLDGTWLQTSYSGSFRGRYCGIGYSYSVASDQFVAPRPFPSWSLDVNNDWQPPTPMPEGRSYWDEDSLSWVELPAG